MNESCLSCRLQCEFVQVEEKLDAALGAADARVGQAKLGFEVTSEMAEEERVQSELEDLIASDPDAIGVIVDDPAITAEKANMRANLFSASSASARGVVDALQEESDAVLRGRGPAMLQGTALLHQMLTNSCSGPQKRLVVNWRARSIGLVSTCGSPAAAARRHLESVDRYFPGVMHDNEPTQPQ